MDQVTWWCKNSLRARKPLLLLKVRAVARKALLLLEVRAAA